MKPCCEINTLQRSIHNLSLTSDNCTISQDAESSLRPYSKHTKYLNFVQAVANLIRAFPFSVLFAPTALTKGLCLLFVQAKPAQTANIDRKWPAKQASMQRKERMGRPCGCLPRAGATSFLPPKAGQKSIGTVGAIAPYWRQLRCRRDFLLHVLCVDALRSRASTHNTCMYFWRERSSRFGTRVLTSRDGRLRE